MTASGFLTLRSWMRHWRTQDTHQLTVTGVGVEKVTSISGVRFSRSMLEGSIRHVFLAVGALTILADLVFVHYGHRLAEQVLAERGELGTTSGRCGGRCSGRLLLGSRNRGGNQQRDAQQSCGSHDITTVKDSFAMSVPEPL
jgi:hypothetical protein